MSHPLASGTANKLVSSNLLDPRRYLEIDGRGRLRFEFTGHHGECRLGRDQRGGPITVGRRTALETRCCVLLKCRQLRVRVERVLMGVLPMLAVAVTYF